MAIFDISPGRSAGVQPPRLVESICLAVIIAEVVFLAGSYFTGMWLVAADGGGVATDFVNVWAAGRLALGGHAGLGLRLADPQARRRQRARPCVRWLLRLALPAAILVRRRRPRLTALRLRLSGLDRRDFPDLSRGDTHHHRRSHRLSSRRRISSGPGEFFRRPKRISQRRACSAARSFSSSAVNRSSPACCSGC